MNLKAILLTPKGFDNCEARAASQGKQGGNGEKTSGAESHAILWSGDASHFLDLHPLGFRNSVINALSEGAQAGTGQPIGAQPRNGALSVNHALLWRGTAKSVMDLHPRGFDFSNALGVWGASQVGLGGINGQTHALLWRGTARSVVDLHPQGFQDSEAWGVGINVQVGWAGKPILKGSEESVRHALLWRGSAKSFTDLHPRGFKNSQATGISGTQQVGYGDTETSEGNHRALLWSGTAKSAIDLTPKGFRYCQANAISGKWQVGFGGGPATGPIALLWSGTAQSVVDLHYYLKELPLALASSEAHGIDSSGDIVGIARDGDGKSYTIKWSILK